METKKKEGGKKGRETIVPWQPRSRPTSHTTTSKHLATPLFTHKPRSASPSNIHFATTIHARVGAPARSSSIPDSYVSKLRPTFNRMQRNFTPRPDSPAEDINTSSHLTFRRPTRLRPVYTDKDPLPHHGGKSLTNQPTSRIESYLMHTLSEDAGRLITTRESSSPGSDILSLLHSHSHCHLHTYAFHVSFLFHMCIITRFNC